MSINLDQILETNPVKPFSHVTIKGKEYGVYFPDQLSKAKHLKHQKAALGMAKAYDVLMQGSDPGMDDAQITNIIKKVLARNKSKLSDPVVYEMIAAGQYWPWDEQGPVRVQTLTEDGKERPIEDIQTDREEIELFLSGEQVQELTQESGDSTVRPIKVDGQDWGLLMVSDPTDISTLDSVCLALGNKLPKVDRSQVSMIDVVEIESARFEFKQPWCESLFMEDISLDEYPPSVINQLYSKLEQEMKEARDAMNNPISPDPSNSSEEPEEKKPVRKTTKKTKELVTSNS